MTRGLLEAEVYVEDLGLGKGLTIKVSEDISATFFLDVRQSLEVAEKLESIVAGRCDGPLVLEEVQGSLRIEPNGMMRSRIRIDDLSIIVDGYGGRRIAQDLRRGEDE